MKAAIDRDLCIGCGLCATICSGIFAIDDEGQAVVVMELIPKEFEACTKEAKEQCPVSAINVE